MRNAMLISTLLIFFPAYIGFSQFMGNHGLWFAFILFMIARGITMSLMARKSVYARIA
jgi:MATE family multidrug resistance protein